MIRTIDAENLKKRINAEHPGWYGIMEMTALIDDEPTIDRLDELAYWIIENFCEADYDAQLILGHIHQMQREEPKNV